MKKFLISLMVVLMMIPAVALAKKPVEWTRPDTLRMGTSEFAPLVMNADGKLIGADIEFMGAIADEMNLPVTFRLYPLFSDMLSDVRDGKIMGAIGGISVTPERELFLDYTREYMRSGLRTLTKGKVEHVGRWQILKETVLNKDFLVLLVAFCVLAIVYAVVFVKLAEFMVHLITYFLKKGWFSVFRRRNPQQKPPAWVKGMSFEDATWASAAAMTTWGPTPIPDTWLGKFFMIPQFFTGQIIAALIIGPISAAYTVKEIVRVDAAITSSDDLKGKRVSTIAGTTSVDILREIGAVITTETTEEAMYKDVLEGKTVAAVFDNPSVLWYVRNNPGVVTTAGEIFDEQYYAIALPQGSPLTEEFNRAILKLKANGVYDKILKKYGL